MESKQLETIFFSYGYELTYLITTGGYWLEKLYREKDKVVFSEWSNNINKDREEEFSKKQLRWLWKALVSEPRIKETFDKNFLISYTQELKQQGIRIDVLPKNEKIAIFLKNHFKKNTHASISSLPKPDGIVKLKQILQMQPAKEDFFECSDVDAELTFEVLQPKSIEEEAKLMDLELKALNVENNCIVIQVDSLNYAYNRIDFRLCKDQHKNKKDYGGSIYHGNLAWINGQQYISLSKIKQDVEEDEWKFPKVNE